MNRVLSGVSIALMAFGISLTSIPAASIAAGINSRSYVTSETEEVQYRDRRPSYDDQDENDLPWRPRWDRNDRWRHHDRERWDYRENSRYRDHDRDRWHRDRWDRRRDRERFRSDFGIYFN